jgi:hypothetical protein
MRRHPYLLPFYFCLFFLTSCGTLWPTNDQHCPLVLPEGAQLFDTSGRAIPVDTLNQVTEAHLYYPKNDLLVVKFNNTFYAIQPRKSLRLLTLLDFIGTMGVGSFIDDVSHNDFECTEIRFDPKDTLTAVPYSTAAIPINSRSQNRLRFILQADFGGIYNFNQSPLFITPRGSVGIGLGYRRSVEIYGEYLVSVDGKQITGTTLSELVNTRIYPVGGVYLGLGVGFVHAYSDTLYLESHRLSSLPRSSFKEVLVSVGYSASWTYCEANFALSSPAIIALGDQSVRYSFWTIKCGLNIPIF